MSEHPPRNPNDVPSASGIITALVCAALMIGAFVLATAATSMPPAERWAALTTFSLLALAYALQGSPELYDRLGRTVQRNPRALVPLLLLLPALYISYSSAVGLFGWAGLLAALAFVLFPALLFWQSHRQRVPTLPDLAAALYLLLAIKLNLLPELQLPQQGGQVGFFAFGAVPLLLLLLAARGWPGLGFTWFMNWPDLGKALAGALALLAVLVPVALLAGFAELSTSVPAVLDILVLAVGSYFLVALPQEVLFRGLLQNGIERFAEAKLWRGPGSLPQEGLAALLHPRTISLVCASLIAGSTYLLSPAPPPGNVLLATIASLWYGWVYQHTGKVTVSAVAHMLVIWCWVIVFG